jgi:hypothetical protein
MVAELEGRLRLMVAELEGHLQWLAESQGQREAQAPQLEPGELEQPQDPVESEEPRQRR